MWIADLKWRTYFALVCGGLFFSCSSTPPGMEADAPAWVHDATRTMDSGYIVYVGQGQNTSPERARFNAEAVAIGDLTNECSFAPKGARIEDRYEEKIGEVYYVWAKLGLTFEECEGAKKAVDPEDIRKLANSAMADQWKRYQDLYYTTDKSPTVVAQAPDVLPAPPSDLGAFSGDPAGSVPSGGSGGWVAVNDSPDYYILRQQVALAKQGVILGSPTLYPPGSPQTNQFTSHLITPTNQIHNFESSHPVLASNMAWSGVQQNPEFKAPTGMATHRPGVGSFQNWTGGYRSAAGSFGSNRPGPSFHPYNGGSFHSPYHSGFRPPGHHSGGGHFGGGHFGGHHH